MKNTRFCNIRFNLENPVHNKVWEYLRTMDRDKYKSYSNAVINAVNAYFENEYSSNSKETEWEKRLNKRIIAAIKKALPRLFPRILQNAYLMTINQI